MPASTPGQRAKWRMERAIKSGRGINPADLELMQSEGMPLPQNLSPDEMAKQGIPPAPTLDNQDKEPLPSRPSIQPDPILLHPNQNPSISPLQEQKGQSLRGISGVENTQQLKKLTKNEKVHVEFWATEFGPICVLFLWFTLADLDKATFYAPSPDECRAASIPLGRISARASERLNMPEWAGDAFMTAIDMKDLGFAVVSYLERVGVLNRLQNYYSGVAARATRKGDGSVGPSTNTGEVSNGYVDLSRLGIGSQYRPI